MGTSMRELKDTAMAHMARQLRGGAKWQCGCEACREIRALVGMDKLLGVWPLIRALEQLHDEIEQLPDGSVKQERRAEWGNLYDQLATEMAR